MCFNENDIKEMMIVFSLANICIFFLLVSAFYTTSYKIDKSASELLSVEEKKVDIVASEKVLFVEDYQGQRDSSMEEIFEELIVGRYEISENIEFNFGLNGVYSGFFDNSNRNVSGYKYDVIVIDEVPILNIYDNEETAMVSYELILSGTSNITIYYPKTELKIKLE